MSRRQLIKKYLLTTCTDTLVMKMAVCQSTHLFNKKKGTVHAGATMLSAKHIKNLEAVELPEVDEAPDVPSAPVEP